MESFITQKGYMKEYLSHSIENKSEDFKKEENEIFIS
jgi:hypothetical protein